MASSTSDPFHRIHSLYESPKSCRDEWMDKYNIHKSTLPPINNLQVAAATTKRFAFLDAIFVSPPGNEDLLLVACASDGCLYVWKIPSIQDATSDDDTKMMRLDDPEAAWIAGNDESTHSPRAPYRICQVSNRALFTLHLKNDSPNNSEQQQGRRLLCVGGDDGIVVLDFGDFWRQLVESETTNCSLASLKVTGCHHFPTHPTVDPQTLTEVNQVLVLGEYMYAAVGDAFGLYKWHLETRQLIKTYSGRPGSAYLQSLQALPSVDGSPSNHLVTGGEDGVVNIWDYHHDQLVSSHNVAAAQRNPRNSSSNNQQWITSIAVLDENWFSVVGGCSSSQTRDGGEGFVSTFSTPTRSVVSSVETLSKPQRAVFLPSNRSLATVANESAVSYWHPTNLDKPTHTTCCNSPSAYCLAVAPDGRIAVCGVGGLIDVLDEHGTRQTISLARQE